jgi:predicted  nucleic acid-binding Zn-ribbon protein
MAQSDDLEARVSALEAQVGELNDRVGRSEHDAAAARVLAGGADRDVHEMRDEIRDFRRATTASFNALRQDFTDLRQDFTDLRQHVDDGFTEIRGKLDAGAAGHQQLVEMLTTLIERDAARGQSRDEQ